MKLTKQSLLFLLVIICGNAFAEQDKHIKKTSTTSNSLCLADEIVVFSCQIGNKTVSMCASSDLTWEKGSLYYVFGTSKKIELRYPQELEHPKLNFMRGIYYHANKEKGEFISFKNNGVRYSVYSTDLPEWTKQGVFIDKNGELIKDLPCNKIEPTLLAKTSVDAQLPIDQDGTPDIGQPSEASKSTISIPDDLQLFIEPKTSPIFYKAFDLDQKGNQAVLLILEKQPKTPNSEPIRDNQRILMVLQRNIEERWDVAVRNDNLVMCSLCGGMFGDPFQIEELEVKTGAFTLNFEGGGWHRTLIFQYDIQRNDWFLAQFDDASANRSEATVSTSNKTYPKDFSYTSLKKFNPDSFLESLNVN